MEVVVGLSVCVCVTIYVNTQYYCFFDTAFETLTSDNVHVSLTTKLKKKKNHDTKTDSYPQPRALEFNALPTWPLNCIGKL